MKTGQLGTWQAKTIVTLFLVLIMGSFMVMMITRSMGEAGEYDICNILPFLCKEQEPAYFEYAKASTQTLVCAINSVAKGEKDTSGFCDEYHSSGNKISAAGSGPTSYLTALGAQVAESTQTEEEMEKPSFECTEVPVVGSCCEHKYYYALTAEDCQKYGWEIITSSASDFPKCLSTTGGIPSDKVCCRQTSYRWSTSICSYDEKSVSNSLCGKGETLEIKRCTVKNFQLPQDVSNVEEWVTYWGDPKFLIYWGTFPHEEDTWNFEVDWKVTGVIALLSMIPPGKAASLGFKTIFTALKGPGKQLLARETTKLMMKKGSKEFFGNVLMTVASKNKKISATAISKALGKIGTELSEAEAEEITKNIFSKLSKNELKSILGASGVKIGRGAALKELMKKDLMELITYRFKKIGKDPIKQTLILGGKFTTGMAAVTALAFSMMKKYDPVGNAMALKSPGIKTEDMNTLQLSDKMEGKPVLVAWRPGRGSWEMKNAHFASPCHLREFDVNYKEKIICESYKFDSSDKSTDCEVAVVRGDAEIQCNVFDISIDGITDLNIYYKIKDLLKMKDKKLFEVDEKQSIKKIYLPWFLSDDKSGSKYHLSDFEFISEKYIYGTIAGTSETRETKDVKIDDWVMNSLNPKHSYKAKLSEGTTDLTLVLVEDDEYKIMERGNEYVLHVYHITDKTLLVAGDDVAVDVYDLGRCTKIIGTTEEPYKQLSCEDVKKSGIPDKKISDMEEIIRDVQKTKDKEVLIKVKPDNDVKAKDLDVFGGIKGCGKSVDKQNCFRVFSEVLVNIKCEMKDRYGPITSPAADLNGKYHEVCEIKHSLLKKDLDKNPQFIRYVLFKTEPPYEITDIIYSTQTYELPKNVMITFDDDDEDDSWETLTLYKGVSFWQKINPFNLFKKEKKKGFMISFSDIQDNGDYNFVSMGNCKTDGVVISFEDGLIDKSKMDVEGSNYCMRQLSGWGKVLKIGGDIAALALGIAAFVVGDGPGAALAIAGGLTWFGGEMQKEYKKKWPKSAGG